MLTPEEIRARLDSTLSAERVRAVYHRAMGELIVFRLAFVSAPEFSITEDLNAEAVTVESDVATEPLVLHATDDHAPQRDYDAIRAWIEQNIDIATLQPAKRGRSPRNYWRTHPDRQQW